MPAIVGFEIRRTGAQQIGIRVQGVGEAHAPNRIAYHQSCAGGLELIPGTAGSRNAFAECMKGQQGGSGYGRIADV